MKKKTNNTTTQTEKTPKITSHPFGVGIAHYKQDHATRLADAMIIECIHNEDILTFTDFLFSKGLFRDQFNTLAEKFPCLADAKKIAMEAIANRREKSGLRKKLDTQMILASMSMYSPEWKALAEWKSQLNKQEEQKPSVINVIMEPFNAITEKKEDN